MLTSKKYRAQEGESGFQDWFCPRSRFLTRKYAPPDMPWWWVYKRDDLTREVAGPFEELDAALAAMEVLDAC